MNYICSWFCADEQGEESIFPQTGQKSSSKGHQDIYWRCLALFYATSRRFNKDEKHLLFTNVKQLPVLDGKPVNTLFNDMDVEVIYTDFKYKTPKGYFGMFQNQFYEFSILEYITKSNINANDNYLILDSDCIFLKPAAPIFAEAGQQGFLSFEDDCTTDLVIHGLSRKDMKLLYQELLGEEVHGIPGYHLGEFFMASVKNVNTIFADFLELWPRLLERYKNGQPKFNEEAQTLSYIYYKNHFIASPKRDILKRIWTNPVFYRNVAPTDVDVAIWHLPSEKTYGLKDLYTALILKNDNYGFNLTDGEFKSMVTTILAIPTLGPLKKISYYIFSYYRAIKKRIKKQFVF